ncbi:MAG: hypothetical protein N2Z65_03870 [Clostridiales bacterium]|nr:hypothetical protein [Clostridiales bacterium]
MYYNQNNYSNVPYPSAGNPTATVKTGGSGVCCASMVVEELTGEVWPPDESALYAMKAGARITGDTKMELLASCIAKDFGLMIKTTNDINVLVSHLTRGLAIINVGGDRTGYTGLFSDIGCYIVAAGIKDGKVIIYDPGFYEGKFLKTGRRGKVSVSGDEIYVAPEWLDKDTENCSPRYYLFGVDNVEGKSVPSSWAEDAAKWATENGLITGNKNGDYMWQNVLSRETLAVILKKYHDKFNK